MDQFVSIRIRRRWLKLGAGIAMLAVVLAPVAVSASHQFTDVPDSNVFHDDIAWLADNGVTKGCNPPANDQFCPSANVTREQMGAFMRRLAAGRSVDAGTLEGQTANDLTSNAYSVWHDEEVEIADNGAAVLQLTGLPAGDYLVIAKTYLTLKPFGTISHVADCELVGGDSIDKNQVITNAAQPATFTILATYASDGGTAELNCLDRGNSLYANWIKITAISVGTVTNTPG